MSLKDNVPFQVQTLISNMLNKNDDVLLRGNYRMRLDVIRNEIEKAIRQYDDEAWSTRNKKGKRA